MSKTDKINNMWQWGFDEKGQFNTPFKSATDNENKKYR